MSDFGIGNRTPEQQAARDAEAFRIKAHKEKLAEREKNTVEFGEYSLELEDYGDLRVNGCDCAAYVPDVETAQKMIELIQKWIATKQ